MAFDVDGVVGRSRLARGLRHVEGVDREKAVRRLLNQDHRVVL